jgi:hypothetical protein
VPGVWVESYLCSLRLNELRGDLDAIMAVSGYFRWRAALRKPLLRRLLAPLPVWRTYQPPRVEALYSRLRGAGRHRGGDGDDAAPPRNAKAPALATRRLRLTKGVLDRCWGGP